MNRRQRRAQMKGRLRVLQGGKLAEALPRVSTNRSTPQARLYGALDDWTKQQMAKEPELAPTDYVAIYLRYAALLAAQLTESNAEDFSTAATELFRSEDTDGEDTSA